MINYQSDSPFVRVEDSTQRTRPLHDFCCTCDISKWFFCVASRFSFYDHKENVKFDAFTIDREMKFRLQEPAESMLRFQKLEFYEP